MAASNILWAPWRMPYIQGLTQKSPCFLCDYIRTPHQDRENLVLWRTPRCLVVLNRFPYNNGHLLIAPLRHIAALKEADEAEMLEMLKLVREAQKALTLAVQPHGFNVGMNFGRCAGAGLPEHLHVHIVPRWEGDTNFMSVCSDTKVISQSLAELYDQLSRLSQEHHLPAGL
ncbi:MAG TPA: HIT domain-containing protein [Anaerohalosphaeraceae bacterium]|nr:HIT domain-containing protein [Anaerohalosphaeraceae bacterium]HQG05380.1 HIT domain-containing protein [Anaerohalosphaeraceae bacterium]HQI06753.1 HIT domain-containing protein [Anaerohalosphaeraceae bacterium]HQJ67174.1 HIT domain-containing protein [Anaerohalosphaeraceae bacterium]